MGERKPRVFFNCSHCGRRFGENSSQARKRLKNKDPTVQNCSVKCYAEWRKAHKKEKVSP